MATTGNFIYAKDSEILYTNSRFEYLYKDAKSSLEEGNYEESKVKVSYYLDKVNFSPCDGYQLLIDLEQKKNGDNNGEIYQKIYDSCQSFGTGNYKNGFKIFESINIDDYKNDLFVYSIFRFYEMFLPEIDNSGYNISYNGEEDLDYLLKNKDYLISKFPLTYGTRLAAIYYDNKEIGLFNSIYKNFLTKDDFFLKLIFEMYYYDLNGGEIGQISKLFKYENLKRKDENGSLYREDIYTSIYKILFRESFKINDKKLIIKYFFEKENIYSNYRKLYTREIVGFFNQINDLYAYKEYIIENISSITYPKEDKTGSLVPIKNRAINYYNFLDAYHFLSRFIGNDYISPGSIAESNQLLFSLNSLFTRFNDIKNDRNSDSLIDIKKSLIQSIEKIFILNKGGKLIITSDLSEKMVSIIESIPDLRYLTSKDLTISSLNERNTFSEKYLYYILVLILLTFLMVIIFKRRG